MFFTISANIFIYDPQGKHYMGTMNVTRSFTPCKSWNNSVIKEFLGLNGDMFADRKIPGAVCRNPDVPSKTNPSPWCIVDIDTLKEELCDLTEGSEY